MNIGMQPKRHVGLVHLEPTTTQPRRAVSDAQPDTNLTQPPIYVLLNLALALSSGVLHSKNVFPALLDMTMILSTKDVFMLLLLSLSQCLFLSLLLTLAVEVDFGMNLHKDVYAQLVSPTGMVTSV